jgi:hypothetical protein
MLKTKVLEELHKGQEQTERSRFSAHVVESVQKLLAYESQKDVQMLNQLGMDNHIKAAQNMEGRKITLEKFREDYKGKVFHVDTLKTLCENYRLRMLKSRYYKGVVDVEVTAKIKEFFKESKEALTGKEEYYLQECFYVMAPDNAFNKNMIEIPKLVKQPVDPLLFFKIDNEHYRLVHKWGNDFSIFRAILGWKWKSELNHFLFGLVLATTLSVLFCSLIFPVSAIGGFWFYAAVALTGLITAAIHHQSNVKNDNFLEQNLTRNCWNTPDQYH